MIRMTKRGELPAEKPYKGTCSTCKSEYIALQGDLKYESDYHDSWYEAKCELCSSTVYFTQVVQ
jgi:demethoxyubiquinone hydroxylase (CLK1/Coq7/Cat5 family)